MNLIDGALKDGNFTSDGMSISGLSGPDGPVTLGFRAEDAQLSDKATDMKADIYTIELLGDATMLTFKTNSAMISIKAHKEYRAEIGQNVSISVPAEICHLFDSQTGERIDAS